MRARSSKSFFRPLYMQTIAEEAEVHFVYFTQRDQLHKQWQKTKPKSKFYFKVTFSLQELSWLL